MALCDSEVSLKYIRSPRPARVPWSQKQNSNNKNTRQNKTKKGCGVAQPAEGLPRMQEATCSISRQEGTCL